MGQNGTPTSHDQPELAEKPSRRGRIATRMVKFVVKRWKKGDPPTVVRQARRVFGLPNFLAFLYSRHLKIRAIESPVRGEWLTADGAGSSIGGSGPKTKSAADSMMPPRLN